MCIYYDINVMIVNNVFYYEIDNNSENINVVFNKWFILC